jgi:hypothetical protein
MPKAIPAPSIFSFAIHLPLYQSKVTMPNKREPISYLDQVLNSKLGSNEKWQSE